MVLRLVGQGIAVISKTPLSSWELPPVIPSVPIAINLEDARTADCRLPDRCSAGKVSSVQLVLGVKWEPSRGKRVCTGLEGLSRRGMLTEVVTGAAWVKTEWSEPGKHQLHF